jgi:phosphoserine phosphatase
LTATHIEIQKWTTEEFERQVFECKPKVAVFDCDGTLWGGDAGYGFMAWSLERGLVSRSTHDWLDTRYRDYRAGNVSEAAMCGEMVQMYAGLREAELRAAAAKYVDKFVRQNIFEEMLALIARMREAGTEI